MDYGYDTMMNPAIEGLLERTESKFILVTLASKRSREITNYVSQLGEGIGRAVPPQVISTAVKPLSIALEEIAAGKIKPVAAADDDPEESNETDETELTESRQSQASSGETGA